MPPVSRRRRLTDYLKGCDDQRARRSDIVRHLKKWMTEEQADRAIDDALADTSSAITASWGRSLVYWGLENRSTVALYDAVGRVFAEHWGPKVFGLKPDSRTDRRSEVPGPADIVATRPRGKSGRDWTRPDLVAFAHPRRKRTSTSPREIHAFEIEQQRGFKIQSIYQAYEQARGANYAWVFAHADHIPSQFAVAAEELGVGVVIFSNPNSWTSYSGLPKRVKCTCRPASPPGCVCRTSSIMPHRRDVAARARAEFLTTVGVEDMQ